MDPTILHLDQCFSHNWLEYLNIYTSVTYILNDDIVLLLCRCLGGRQSFNARQRERLNSSFESLEDSRDRVNRAASEEDTGQKKKKDHIRDYSKMTWNKQALKK